MHILLRNMARVELPDDKRTEVLKMYCHENRNGDVIQNYRYKDGVAYLPLNRPKLEVVASILGQEIVDERSLGAPLKEPFSLKSDFAFRPHQEEPVPKLLEFTKRHQYAVLKAPCSCGKTVSMTWVAGHLGRKTLVLVDQGNLAGQWQEAFQTIVWGKKAAILKKEADLAEDVVIATFQLLHRNPDLLRKMKDMFGTCLIDEFHTSGAKTFRQVLFKLNNYYRIGTSATIMKKGFSNEILTDLVAPVSIEMVDDKALVPEIRFIDTGVSFTSNNPDDFTRILTDLAESQARNDLIVALLKALIKANRRVLFVGSRISALQYLHDRLKEFCNPVLYVGSTTLKQDQALRDGVADGSIDVVLAERKIEKGVDLPRLDTLVLAKPMNNEATVTQVAGRILRPCEGKPKPVIFDLVDRGSLAWRFARNRFYWYKKLGYTFDKPDYFFLHQS